MNTNEFEKKLKQQPLRPIPGDWREDILRTAQEQAASATKPPRPALIRVAFVAWRELIQPFRYAWSGMAALWVIFWIVNARLGISDSPGRPMASIAEASERIRLFDEQRQVLVELTDPDESSPAEPPKQAHPKPRSDRMIEIRCC